MANTNQRKSALKTILKEAKITEACKKIAEDVNLAAENPEEYAHKVFEALLKNLDIEGLDD